MTFVLFADGASRGNPGPAAYGAVVYDVSGNLVAELGENLGIRTNNYAEYQGVIAGLRHIEAHWPGAEVLVKMDSKLVVEQLSGRWQIKHPELRELASEAIRIMRGLSVQLQWIPREQNTAADAAANRALDEGDFGESTELELAAVQPKSIRAPRQSIEPTTFVLIRHGHTQLTESNLISGSNGEDPSLSELGFLEAVLASKAADDLLARFGLGSVSAVLHSPQVRTTQTAQAVAKHFEVGMQGDARLKEIGFGSWEGHSMAEMEASSAAEIERWRGSMSLKPPGGESVDDLEQRVREALTSAIAEYSGQTIAIVSHMMPLRAMLRHALGGPNSLSWTLQFAPASVSVVRYFGPNFAEVFAINSCQHLPTK
jgi:broad specificity phosphatase PhoE/ribonuclease HI